jgi:glycosyltransferase involved in cell wall biosynthesis
METFVFSYQRGPYLDNFLRSVRDCEWPGPVTVVDDRSTDPSTLEVLDRAERSGIAVVRRQHSQGGAPGADCTRAWIMRCRSPRVR